MKNPIPRSALEHHIAFVGKTGSGKTGSAKSGIIEPALAASERVCVIDPTGAWWGLRLDADGKSRGLPIYVFGGDHGDYPLQGTQGEMMAEAIGGSNTPAILDTTRMKTSERMRFFTDFADTILRVNRGPLRLVIDEAHLFAPQAGTRGSGAMPDMLHAANNLISLGRSRGLRIVLISQRPAKVHKDSLTQVESLVAMRLIAPQDRKAVEEWIADQADKETGKEIIASLPSLKAGEAWVWSPEAHFLKRVVFPMPRTYDSSKVQGTGRAKKRLSPIDLEKLQAKFAKVRTEAEAKDPKILAKRVAELEAQLRKANSAPPRKPDADAGAIAAAEARGFGKGFSDAADQATVAFNALRENARATVRNFANSFDSNAKGERLALVATDRSPSGSPAVKQIAADTRKRAPAAMPAARAPSPAASGDGNLVGAQRRILDAIAWAASLGTPAVGKDMVAFLAGASPTSSTYQNNLGALRTAGLVDYPGPGKVQLLSEGAAIAAPSAYAPTHEAIMEKIKAKLTPALMRILQAAAAAYPNDLTKDELAETAAASATSSTYQNNLGRLRSLGFITYPSTGRVRAGEGLFP